MARLIDACRKMQMIQTGIALHERRDQKRIGTAIDVAESPPLLDWPGDRKDSLEAEARKHHAAASFDRHRARHTKVHARANGVRQAAAMDRIPEPALSSINESEVRSVSAQLQWTAILLPAVNASRMLIVSQVDKQPIRQRNRNEVAISEFSNAAQCHCDRPSQLAK